MVDESQGSVFFWACPAGNRPGEPTGGVIDHPVGSEKTLEASSAGLGKCCYLGGIMEWPIKCTITVTLRIERLMDGPADGWMGDWFIGYQLCSCKFCTSFCCLPTVSVGKPDELCSHISQRHGRWPTRCQRPLAQSVSRKERKEKRGP